MLSRLKKLLHPKTSTFSIQFDTERVLEVNIFSFSMSLTISIVLLLLSLLAERSLSKRWKSTSILLKTKQN